jgi:hypothetical protein|tara:strand:+ start:67 stop:330 length:264 start_codon:yes stop_codon:yes gene_type:complete
MIKEIKYLIFTIIIFIFLFFTARYYFSDHNIKKSYRSLTNINNKINLYAENLPILENNTNDIIEYINETKTKKKKKYNFWELLDKND